MTGGTTTLPTITVRASQVSGSFATNYAAFQQFLDQFAGPPPPLTTGEELEPGEPQTLSADTILENNQYFQDLPEDLQEMILASPTARTQLAAYLMSGGRIVFTNEVGIASGRYQAGDPPTISLSQQTYQAATDGSNDAYHSGILAGSLAHELGHWVTDPTHNFSGTTYEQYEQYRAEYEALSIVNAMVISEEVEFASDYNVTLGGYATDSILAPLYNDFQQTHDLDALIGLLVDIIRGNSAFVSQTTTYWNEKHGSGE